MRAVFLFPGQGSQSVGMGKGWIEDHPRREWLEMSRELVGRDIPSLCLYGPRESLDETVVTQPALYVLSAMLLDDLSRRGLRPVAVAGHSAGEYAALLAAGAWDFETGLRVIATRAKIMFELARDTRGSMAAVLGLGGEEVEQICRERFPDGEVVVANWNTPTQTVISGMNEAVDRAIMILKELGARRVVPLPVSGAFHSPLMAPGAQEFRRFLESVQLHPPSVPWISNRTGLPESTPAVIREHLSAQLVSPVQWAKTMATLDEMGCDWFLEVGPGKVLAGLAKGCAVRTPCVSLGSPMGIDSVITKWKGTS